jgi:KipI family sensor histidine kinase inhibitor
MVSDVDMESPSIKPLSEYSLLVEFEPQISPLNNESVHRLCHTLASKALYGLLSVVPSYRSLVVYFDPFRLKYDKLVESVVWCLDHMETVEIPPPRLFRIPTVYGKEHAPDMARIAHISGLNPEKIIELFSKTILRVYFLGFTCSLAYLGGVPEPLHVPRHVTPRKLLAAGSVGFAGSQANILPVPTPSGLNYIGRTFVSVYDPNHFPPTPIRPGDHISCPSVSESDAESASDSTLEDFIVDI